VDVLLVILYSLSNTYLSLKIGQSIIISFIRRLIICESFIIHKSRHPYIEFVKDQMGLDDKK
jgi:hypothetical protein